jgi:hypothetical protein
MAQEPVEDAPQPDPRMLRFRAGMDPVTGNPNPVTRQALADRAAEWPTTASTPSSVGDLLRVSRELFVHSFYVYEFLAVGAAWSLLAVEAGLRDRLAAGDSATFQKMINRAFEQGIFTDAERVSAHAGRDLRNGLSHPDMQDRWTPGVSAPVMRASHLLVASIYPEPD